jgi:hypothetical protein
MNRPALKLDIIETLEFLLKDKYFSEFEIIDGLSQHSKGINFYEWLYEKSLISRNNYERISDWIYLNGEEGL